MGRKDKKRPAKVRTAFRKKHQQRRRQGDLTRDYGGPEAEDDTQYRERVSGKGELTRHRTIIGRAVDNEDDSTAVQLDVDLERCQAGRVLAVHGRNSVVDIESAGQVTCHVRGLLKNLSTDQRNVVVAGDHVLVEPTSDSTGTIVSVLPRRGVISRTSRKRQHVIVSNVDQVVIVTSAAEPSLKPNLVDRMIISAEKAQIRPIICINKVDLVDAGDIQPLAGSYAQLGYHVLLTSAESGRGCQQLKHLLLDKETVFTGQSGVGKSSLLNTVAPGLELEVNEVSRSSQKGRHTTTAARLLPLEDGGYVVDTPGIRQFQLWDVIPEEVAGFFRDIRTLVNLCQFPDCSHTHELNCAVKNGVADGFIDVRRYESYCQIIDVDLD